MGKRGRGYTSSALVTEDYLWLLTLCTRVSPGQILLLQHQILPNSLTPVNQGTVTNFHEDTPASVWKWKSHALCPSLLPVVHMLKRLYGCFLSKQMFRSKEPSLNPRITAWMYSGVSMMSTVKRQWLGKYCWKSRKESHPPHHHHCHQEIQGLLQDVISILRYMQEV